MSHLIFDDLTFNEKYKTFFAENNFQPLNKEYQTLAIIGCQSSGKSTLLNHVFNTTFEVMDETKGRGQTTQGIWAAVNHDINTIIFDVEGTDAKERGDDRFKFEQCSSLFALVMADVLFINMWTNDIGRYTASNYGVLKIVFEMNLRLFQQESEKKIVIILRDFDDINDNKESLEAAILGDMKQIWTEIKKPEKFANCLPEQFFKFEFFTLAHKFYWEEKFNAGIIEIQKRLKKGVDNNAYLFNHVNYEKNVPIDGMFKYTWDMWSNIINNKDLNIPNQKEMLAQYRCNEIKDQSLVLVNELIAELELESSMKKMNDFKEKCEVILSKASDNYDALAKEYVPHIYQDIRKHLYLSLSQSLYSCFGNQSKRLIPEYQKTFRLALEKATKECDNFLQCSQEIKKKFLDEINGYLKKITLFESWECHEINDLFDDIIENQRGIAFEENKIQIIKKVKNIVEDSLLTKLESITQDFWLEMNQELLQHYQSIVLVYKNYLSDNYGMQEEQFKTFITPVQEEIYLSIKKDFLKKTKNLSSCAADNFQKSFWYNEGIPRVWNKLTEGFIDEIFKQYKEENMFIFELFKDFKLLKNYLELVDYQLLPEEKINEISDTKIPLLLTDKETTYETLLYENDIKTMKFKYEENINEFYEDAKRRHANIQKTFIPFWAWLIIIYLAYDDILKMLTGYWLIPIIILSALYGLLHMAGFGHVPKMIFGMISQQLTSKFTKK